MVMYDARYYADVRRRIEEAGKRKTAMDLAKGKCPDSLKVPVIKTEIEPEVVPEEPPRGLVKAKPFGKKPPFPPRVWAIVNLVCKEYGISYEDLAGYSHKTKLMMPRVEVTVALRDTGMSLTQIAKVLCRDHSTIVHSLQSKRANDARQQWIRREQEQRPGYLGGFSDPAMGYPSIAEACRRHLTGQPSEEGNGQPVSVGTGVQPGLYGEAA